jgi:hypothetical protein
VYGSLFEFDVDVPENWKSIAQKLIQTQKVEFKAAGLTLDWSGPKRSFSVSNTSIEITPGISLTVNKWFLSYTCRLDGFQFTPELDTVTVMLGGAPDVTVRLK